MPIKGIFVDTWHVGVETIAKVDELINFCNVTGITDIYLQVRRRADAYYDSAYEPKANVGEYPYTFDLLAEILKKAGNIRVHAYLTMFQLWRIKNANVGQFPVEWTMRDNKEVVYLNPLIPAVQDHLTKVCKDIVSKYNVYGLCFESFRYPERVMIVPGQEFDIIEESPFEVRFETLTALLERIRIETGEVRDIELSCCVKSNGDTLDHDVQFTSADWINWLDNGVIDKAICLLMNKKIELIRRWSLLLKGKSNVIVGLGPCFVSLEGLREHIDIMKNMDLVFFSYETYSKDKTESRSEFIDILKSI